MARTARKDIDARFFHVMVQGIDKDFVFFDDECKRVYLQCIAKRQLEQGSSVKLLAFCIMSNHAHLVIAPESIADMSAYMKRINTAYAMYYNDRLKRVGYVFRDRYRSEAIRSERQLEYCVAYVHNNPLKAGLVSDAEQYDFSSFRCYLNQNGLIDLDEAAKFYDVSPSNMRAVMAERTDGSWIEHDEKEYEDFEAVIAELVTKYQIESKWTLLQDTPLLRAFTEELQSRTGANLTKIADILEISRQTLYRIFKRTSD